MASLMLEAQRNLILQAIKDANKAGQWKILLWDKKAREIITNVIQEEEILDLNITNCELIEGSNDRKDPTRGRSSNQDIDAIYFLSPQSHVINCLWADLTIQRYRSCNLIWTTLLPQKLRKERIDKMTAEMRDQIRTFVVTEVDFFARESNLVTFRDPWEFPILFSPFCQKYVLGQIDQTAQKIMAVCVALGEYPNVRYYVPPNPSHDASTLCRLLGEKVQEQLDMYAKYHDSFPAQSQRPRATLFVCDRTMDLRSPFLHDFTYQSMAYDLLPIRDGEKITFRSVTNKGQRNEEKKDIEISESDQIWLDNRHRHMKDTIDKLMSDFQKFLAKNPNFTKQSEADAASLGALRDMVVGLPQFQQLKEAYSLHLGMAQDCMNIFQNTNLPEVALVEQTLATGLDEDFKKPKGIAEQLIRLLDDENVTSPDRMRLLALYLIFRDGLFYPDLEKLMLHAGIPNAEVEKLLNLQYLGVKVERGFRDNRAPSQILFPCKPPPPEKVLDEGYQMARYQTSVQQLLESYYDQTLSKEGFPYVKAPLEDEAEAASANTASLRTGRPTWARKATTTGPRQRVIVYVAGGATWAEAAACYEASRKQGKDVVLVTSHMQNPKLFMRQMEDLSVEDLKPLVIPVLTPARTPDWANAINRSDNGDPSLQQYNFNNINNNNSSNQQSTNPNFNRATPPLPQQQFDRRGTPPRGTPPQSQQQQQWSRNDSTSNRQAQSRWGDDVDDSNRQVFDPRSGSTQQFAVRGNDQPVNRFQSDDRRSSDLPNNEMRTMRLGSSGSQRSSSRPASPGLNGNSTRSLKKEKEKKGFFGRSKK